VRLSQLLKRGPAWGVIILSLLAFVADAFGAVPEYSASFVEEYAGEVYGGMIYSKAPNIWRKEIARGPHKSIVILNVPKKAMWTLYPDKKTYCLHDAVSSAPELMPETAKLSRAEVLKALTVSSKLVGQEMVNGYLCDKYATVYGGRLGTYYQWVAKKLGLIVKIEWIGAIGGYEKYELRNIRLRKLPDSLFQVPKGYRQVPPPAPRAKAERKSRGH